MNRDTARGVVMGFLLAHTAPNIVMAALNILSAEQPKMHAPEPAEPPADPYEVKVERKPQATTPTTPTTPVAAVANVAPPRADAQPRKGGWPEEDKEKLIVMFKQGKTYGEMADILGKNYNYGKVASMIAYLRRTRPDMELPCRQRHTPAYKKEKQPTGEAQASV